MFVLMVKLLEGYCMNGYFLYYFVMYSNEFKKKRDKSWSNGIYFYLYYFIVFWVLVEIIWVFGLINYKIWYGS